MSKADGLVETKKSPDKLLDDIVGQFGYYQLLLVVLVNLGKLAVGSQSAGIPVFSTATPAYRCATCFNQTGLETDLYEQKHDGCKQVPVYCKVRKNAVSATNITQVCKAPDNDTLRDSEFTQCPHIEFDQSDRKSTVVTEFGLVCDRKWLKRLAVSIYYIGVTLGLTVSSTASARFGRKPVLIVFGYLIAISTVISSSAPNIKVYMVARFLAGFSVFGHCLCGFTLSVEFIGGKKRNWANFIFLELYSIGELLTTAFAYYFREWRDFERCIIVWTLVVVIPLFWVPESYRWHLSRGDYESARALPHKIAGKQNGQYDREELDRVLKEVADSAAEQNKNTKSKHVLTIFKYRKQRVFTICMIFQWITNTMVYYGTVLNCGNLPGGKMTNYAMMACAEVIAYIAGAYILDHPRIGRRKVNIYGMSTVAICLVLSTILLELGKCGSADTNADIYILAGRILAYTARLTITITFMCIYIHCAELYPTDIRPSCIAVNSIAGRVGAIVSPFVIGLVDYYSWLPQGVFSLTAFVAAAMATFLPETLNQRNLYTVVEAEEFYQKQSQNR